MLYTWNTQHWKSAILQLNWKKKKKDHVCMFHLNSLSTVGEILLLAVCAAVICITTFMDTTLLCYLIFTCLDHYTSTPFPLSSYPTPVYTLLNLKEEVWSGLSPAHELYKLCKVYSLKPSFLNLEAVKGSKPFFFFSDCSFSISFIDLDQISCLDTLPEFRLTIPLPPVWKDDWP